VPAPSGLVAVGRWRTPGRTLDTLVGWSNLPLDWRRMLGSAAPGTASLVAFDAPVEAALVLERDGGAMPDLGRVVSVGLTSFEQARGFAEQRGWALSRLGPDVYRVQGLPDAHCVLARALGTAPVRLVCSDRQRDVEKYWPYAMRGLPTLTMPDAEVRVQVQIAPLRELTHGQRGDRGLGEVVHAVAQEVVALGEDTDQLALDLEFRPDAGLEATLSTRFRGQSAFTLQSLADMGHRAIQPPELFWRLPADSSRAAYGVSADPRRMGSLRKGLGGLLTGYLEGQGISRAAINRVRTALEAEEWNNFGSAWVTAHGAPPTRPAETPSAADAVARRWSGWHLLGFEDLPAQKLEALIGKLLSVYDDPELRKTPALRGLGPEKWPKVSRRGAAGLGAGATLYEIVQSGAPKSATRSLTAYLIVAPSGKRTWIGVGTNRDVILGKLKQVTQGGRGLADRGGLEALGRAKAMFGGFTTLAALSSGAESRLGSSVLRAPSHGETPITDTLVWQDDGPTLVWRWTVPRGTISDVASVLPTFASQMFSR
jgi:hypothetical protein